MVLVETSCSWGGTFPGCGPEIVHLTEVIVGPVKVTG